MTRRLYSNGRWQPQDLVLLLSVVPFGPSGVMVHTLSSLSVALIFGSPCIFFFAFPRLFCNMKGLTVPS